jgi:ADP-ribose pyrophosphatase YjhB (NUDIX family)
MSGDILKAALVQVKDRRLLCARSEGKTAFYIPGGKPEPGEDMRAALVREAAEELNLALDPAALVEQGRYAAPADGASGRTVRAVAFTAEGAGEPRPGAEIAELSYLRAGADVPVSALTRSILDALKAADVID